MLKQIFYALVTISIIALTILVCALDLRISALEKPKPPQFEFTKSALTNFLANIGDLEVPMLHSEDFSRFTAAADKLRLALSFEGHALPKTQRFEFQYVFLATEGLRSSFNYFYKNGGSSDIQSIIRQDFYDSRNIIIQESFVLFDELNRLEHAKISP